MREPEEPELDPALLAPYEDQIKSRDVTPDDFGRIAAQTAKQVILQRVREAERQMMFDEYQDRVGELVTGIIQQSDNRYTLVQLRERVEALLPRSEQVWNERYDHGMRVKAVITDVSAEGKGPSIVVSRRSPELIKELFELEVPEIADDLVEIVGVAREPGFRSKIAVISHADGVDPVGACVGPRGSRVRMVVSELRGEKIDIIPHNDEPARFVAKALSPARVREVIVDDETKEATVIVPDDQLSLAIGREGQNARLAAKLTGWKVDIKSETDFSQEDAGDIEGEGEADDGRCGAITSTGRRCPNASLARLALLRPASAPVAHPLRHQQGGGARSARRRRGRGPRRPGSRRRARSPRSSPRQKPHSATTPRSTRARSTAPRRAKTKQPHPRSRRSQAKSSPQPRKRHQTTSPKAKKSSRGSRSRGRAEIAEAPGSEEAVEEAEEVVAEEPDAGSDPESEAESDTSDSEGSDTTVDAVSHLEEVEDTDIAEAPGSEEAVEEAANEEQPPS